MTADNKPIWGVRPALQPKVLDGLPTKRLTLDIPAELHKRIKLACVEVDSDMVTEITKLLMEKW